jgi:murein DD-endopeptidase MepM/ murein hydrolase activator NlpD
MKSFTQLLKHFPKTYVYLLIVILLLMIVVSLMPKDAAPKTQVVDLSDTLNLELATPSDDIPLTLEPEPQIQPEDWQSVTVKSGDSLSTLFQRVGLSAQDVYKVTQATKKTNALSPLFPGNTLDFLIEKGRLEKVRLIKTALVQTVVERQEDSAFKVTTITRTPDIETRFVQGTIKSSLFVDGQKAGLSQKKLMQLATIFGWDIDFALDIREDDHFALIYEENYLDEKLISEGNILAAQFTNRGKVFNAIRHTDGNYYSPEGYSMRKAFLRSPVDFFRISSKYNPNRKHPVLKTVRPHRGVDYAAATGTPIKASGDGKVIWRGTKGGYGRTIIIQHAGIYTTLYAHMSKYNSKVKNGSRVKQGQVIGYIGSSGLATGPHLHYEFRINDVHKNPLKVKFPNVEPLNKEQMASFKPIATELVDQLVAYQLGTPNDLN